MYKNGRLHCFSLSSWSMLLIFPLELLAYRTSMVELYGFYGLDLQVHMCNKLASRHLRVGLADPSDVPRCDICENAPGMLLFIVIFLLTFCLKFLY